MKDFLVPGATAWLIDKERVRKGCGPAEIIVASLENVITSRVAVTSRYVRPKGSRGWYSERDLFETEAEAIQAWHERARTEYAKELARFNAIVAKLLRFEGAAC